MADTPNNMPLHIAETVQAITQLHAEHHHRATRSDRLVDKITGFVGRPSFLLALLLLAAGWMAANLADLEWGGVPPDPPPFAWLGLTLAFVALLIAVLILTSQRRADRLANLREQMTLEAALMTEQKTRKIIDLLEELRRDSPHVRDRDDAEAAQMAAKADPRAVLDAIEESASQAVRATALAGGSKTAAPE